MSRRRWSAIGARCISTLRRCLPRRGCLPRSPRVSHCAGVEDVVTLMYLNKYLQERTYDVLLVDCPPRAIAALRRYADHPGVVYAQAVWAGAQCDEGGTPHGQTADGDSPARRQLLCGPGTPLCPLEGIEKVLVDPATTSVRLITQAEKMVVRETQRASMYFNLYGMITDQVIINRLVPAGEASWRAGRTRKQAMLLLCVSGTQPVPVATLLV